MNHWHLAKVAHFLHCTNPRNGGVAQVVEYLLSSMKPRVQTPGPSKKTNKQKELKKPICEIHGYELKQVNSPNSETDGYLQFKTL
jgi:hypothetical protein